MTRAFIALLAACCLAVAPDAAAIAEGQPAPPLTARQFDGAPFVLDALRGHVVIVNFWATWCAPCRAEMPALDAYYRAHREQGVTVLAISMDNPRDEAKARDMLAAFAFPGALARDAAFKGYGRIWRLPLTFVIDRDGVLRKDDWYADPGITQAALDAVVTPLLNAR